MQDTEIFLSMKKEIEAESQKEIDAIMAEVKAMEDEAMVSMQKEAKKDADFIDDKIKAILKDITDIIPSYAKIEPLMLTKFMDKVKESLEKNLK